MAEILLTITNAGRALVNNAVTNGIQLPFNYATRAGHTTISASMTDSSIFARGGVPTAAALADKSGIYFTVYHAIPQTGQKTVAILSGNTIIGVANVTYSDQSSKNSSLDLLMAIGLNPRAFITEAEANVIDIITRGSLKTIANEAFNSIKQAQPFLFEGQILFGAGLGNPPKPGKMLVETNVATNAEELAAAQQATVSMADVFNTWTRFSHRAAQFPSNEALPEELAAWRYDATSDTVFCTVNSVTYIGFISPRNYLNYDLDLQVGSTDGDDDAISIIVAANYEDGKLWTLSAVRSTGGYGNWQLVYAWNYNSAATLANRNDVLAWGNGAYGANATAAGYTTNQAGSGWRANEPGARIRVERRGDIIKMWTSELKSNVLKEESLIQIDLSSQTRLHKFRGGSRYGYGSSSQNSSYYKVSSFIDYDDVIVDVQNNRVLVRGQNGWTVDAIQKPQTVIPKGRFAYSAINKKLMYRDELGTLITLN